VLLLGTLVLMVTLALGGTVYSLFNRDLLIGAINEEDGIYVPIVDEEPMQTEEEKPKKEDDDAGGGGGGGRDKPTPTSKGQLATQTKDPIMAPSVTNVKKDFDLQMQASTQGTKNIKQTNDPYGDPNSKYTLSSDGMGSGGGQGSGAGRGQGSGRGSGQGSGIGSGSGSGNGDGNGGGTGSGTAGVRTPPAPPPPRPAGVSQDVKIISKPGAKYTDAARQNQFSGTVRLRVTFTASGQIGSVSAVGSLPYGLTEQAIAAAKSIRFEPAKKDGVPITKIKQIDYSFTLY
jgi:TonB family protein